MQGIAKITWQHPESGEIMEYVLTEGATVTIGRASSNDIYIPEQHVSRQHAVINYREGVFMLNDLSSANGTFVNDQQIGDAFPLASGDEIRLFVPKLLFSAVVSDEDVQRARETGTFIAAMLNSGGGKLVITTGPQEGETIDLNRDEFLIGRATVNHQWQIGLYDPSVSRPHAKVTRVEDRWMIVDLGSSNGTTVNNTPVNEKGRLLNDGDVIALGATLLLFRSN